MKNLKHFTLGFITATCLSATIVGASADGLVKDITAKISYEIKTVLDGKEFNPKDENGNELEPIVHNGRTYLPVRSLCNALGVSVDWENSTKTIILSTQPNYEDAIITINGDNKITLGEINLYLAQIKAQYESLFGEKVWEQEIDGSSVEEIAKDNALTSAQASNVGAMIAKQKGLELSDEDQKAVDKTVDSVMKSLSKEQVASNGITSEVVKKVLVNQKLMQLLFNEEMKDFAPTEQQLNSILDNNVEYKGYQEKGYEYYAKQVRARHILIKTVDDSNKPLSEDKKAEAKKEAEKILAKAEAGEDFATLAKKYSQDPGSKDKGGEYTFARGEMLPEFEDTAFNLKKGQISKVIETMYGYHIIKLEEVIEPTEEDIKEIKAKQENIKKEAIETLKNKAFEKKFEQWKTEYKIEINNEIWKNVKISDIETR